MKVFPLPLGAYQTNCYILSIGERALIVDPGFDANQIIAHIETNGLKPEAILITHGHHDHIGALEEVQKKYNVEVYAHQDEKEYFTNPQLNGSYKMGRDEIAMNDLSFITFFDKDTSIQLLDQKIDVYHVPGHSRGSIAFYFEDHKFVISGDALFKSSIGRTDLPYGNHEQLITSIKTKLFTLPEDTVVCPGNGPATMIVTEKRTNPFFFT